MFLTAVWSSFGGSVVELLGQEIYDFWSGKLHIASVSVGFIRYCSAEHSEVHFLFCEEKFWRLEDNTMLQQGVI